MPNENRPTPLIIPESSAMQIGRDDYKQTLEIKEVDVNADNASKAAEERFPDALTPQQRKRYEVVSAKIAKDLEKICAELDDCQRLSAEDFNIRFNAR